MPLDLCTPGAVSMPRAGVAQEWVFELPSLGADMDSGTIIEWRVSPGDEVSKGDVVARVETEKADIDVEIWTPGVVTELLAAAGSEVPVGTPILQLKSERPAVTTSAQPLANEPPPTPARVSHQPPPAPLQSIPSNRARMRSSPRARTIARERGIDLSSITGSGPNNVVTARDVEQAIPTTGGQPETPRGTSADRMRQVIADRMARANAEIPHYHLELDVDMDRALHWVSTHNEALDVSSRVLPAALLIRAVAVAASQVDALNGFWTDNGFESSDHVNVAVAVSLRRGGLVTPVITDANTLSIDQTMQTLGELVSGARGGSMKSSWMTGATITVTNLGDNGADRVDGVIFPPQVALVGFGRIREIPSVVDGQVVPRRMVTVTLSADHRATDGATGSKFLKKLSQYLQNPE